MASIQVMNGPLDDERRGEALFGGDVLIFTDVAPLRRVSRLAGELLRAVFGEAPARAQFALGPDEFKARASALVEGWRRHPAAVQGFREVLRDVGVELDRGYWDWLHLRIQPHRDFTETGTLGYHRDTWASNIYAQRTGGPRYSRSLENARLRCTPPTGRARSRTRAQHGTSSVSGRCQSSRGRRNQWTRTRSFAS